MHSGVTLAPAVARLVAAEVVRGVHAPELEGVRADRFQSTTVADSITGHTTLKSQAPIVHRTSRQLGLVRQRSGQWQRAPSSVSIWEW